MFKTLSRSTTALAVFVSVLCLAGAGCTKNKTTSPQTERASSLERTNLSIQLPPKWNVRKAHSDDQIYFHPNDRSWLAGPSDWLTPATDTPPETRSFFTGCTITQLPIASSSNLEDWFRDNPLYSEEAMWFLGSTSTLQTEHFNQAIVADEGSTNATRTTSIYIDTNDGYITRVSYFNGVDLDEKQREKPPEITSDCRSIASSLQTVR